MSPLLPMSPGVLPLLSSGWRLYRHCRGDIKMLANYSDELFTTQPQLSEGSGAAGQLGRCWPRYIKLRLILVSCYGSRTNGQTGHGCRPHAQLLSPHLAASTSQYKYFAWWRWHPWKWCEILDSSTDSRQETGLGKYLPTDCAMCNVNNVLQPGHWTAEKCSHLGMLSGAWRLLLSAIPCLDPAQS